MGTRDTSSSGRPFWVHQLVEYLLGGALVAAGVQSPTPIVPAVAGVVLVIWAASTRGVLSAFRLVDRRAHRVVDPLLAMATLVAAVQPVVEVDAGTRLVMGAVAAVHVVVWRGSRYDTARAGVPVTSTPSAPGADDRATEVGRMAGRVAAQGVAAARRAAARRRT